MICPHQVRIRASTLFPAASQGAALAPPRCEIYAPAPTARQSLDTSPHCGQWDTVSAGPYTLLLDLWGEAGASAGSQCSNLVSLSGTSVAWETVWTWTGGSGVKSFSNVQLDVGVNKQLGQIQSMPSTWTWTQSASGTIVADVAYDLFTASTPGGANVNEIMMWLANVNAGPISAVYSASGQPVPVASDLSIAGHTWDLYSGSNGANEVFSFLPAGGAVVESFSGDVLGFIQYLMEHEGVSAEQYLVTAQAGTEATSGSATLTTSAYSLVIN
ncbi:putative xyloglucan-specific endo-beta-1,4-glucanase A [Grifola frondosa]|uniref:Putative xyloglucan-specific endo-beta-1,4-glucanase A n=1 Tax=Grifola frondosa TaxID=5627 RepID=A0A1C7MN83_GRIFR|nr:putative xyloglucan-specific endo-beta-1,4-glucanase A [Grifola frondosa]